MNKTYLFIYVFITLVIPKKFVLHLGTIHELRLVRIGSPYYGQTLHLVGWEVSLLMGLDTTFIRQGSVLAVRGKYYIY